MSEAFVPHTDVLVSLSRYICFSKFCIHLYFDKVFDKKNLYPDGDTASILYRNHAYIKRLRDSHANEAANLGELSVWPVTQSKSSLTR